MQYKEKLLLGQNGQIWLAISELHDHKTEVLYPGVQSTSLLGEGGSGGMPQGNFYKINTLRLNLRPLLLFITEFNTHTFYSYFP